MMATNLPPPSGNPDRAGVIGAGDDFVVKLAAPPAPNVLTQAGAWAAPAGTGITDAPLDGKSYVRQNGEWIVAAAPAGGGPGSGEWFRDMSAPPGVGFYFVAPGKLYVSKVTANGVDVSNIFPIAVKVGADVVIQDKDTVGNWEAFTLTADPIDQGDYFEMSVVSVGGGGSIGAGEKSMLIFMR